MAPENREARVHQVFQRIMAAWSEATPDTGLIEFGVEWDPEYEDVNYQADWGYFTKDKPRHLDHKTREMLVSAVLAFRDRPGVYTHTKNALSEGATVNEMLEVFDVARFPGGGPTRMVGLNVLKRIVDEEGLSGPTDRPAKEEELAPASETRAEKVRRITAKIHSDLGYEDEALAFGVELDPDYFEIYCKSFWGFFEGRTCHTDPVTRELVICAVMAFRGMRDELYEHAKKALRLGGTMMQLLEGFQVCTAPGGPALLHEGLRASSSARRRPAAPPSSPVFTSMFLTNTFREIPRSFSRTCRGPDLLVSTNTTAEASVFPRSPAKCPQVDISRR